VRGVGEGREEQHLLVLAVDRALELIEDLVPQTLELAVVLGGDEVHDLDQLTQGLPVVPHRSLRHEIVSIVSRVPITT